MQSDGGSGTVVKYQKGSADGATANSSQPGSTLKIVERSPRKKGGASPDTRFSFHHKPNAAVTRLASRTSINATASVKGSKDHPSTIPRVQMMRHDTAEAEMVVSKLRNTGSVGEDSEAVSMAIDKQQDAQ